MNTRKPALTAIVACVGSVLATGVMSHAWSKPGLWNDEAPIFEEIDKNSDGAISKEEAMDSWLAQAFAKVDTNGDGYVTKAEYEAAS